MEAAKVKDERKESQSKEKLRLKPKKDKQIKPKTDKKTTLKQENLTTSQQNKATLKAEDNQENQLLTHAIKNAEEYKLQTAKNMLTELLKKNQKNVFAWIWFSRVVTDLNIIEKSLKNAYKINPKNPELLWEIDNLKLFKKINPSSNKCRRCPFCWCLVSINAKECISCNSILDPAAFFEKNVNISDISLLEKKVTMFKKIIEGSEKNKMVLFFLYLALSNLNKWDESLHYLVKAMGYYPDNIYFSTQLNLAVKKLSLQKSKEKIAAKYKKCIKKTILVVEDSPTTRMIITSTLKKGGYNIVEAGDGLEALNKINSTFPDMIILDIILPKMDGYQFLSIVKKNSAFKDLPVIMLTAKKKFIDKVKGKVAGSDIYLTKPFKPEKLKGLVESILA
jgi:twitching motility two-component system response regulator PilG